MRPCFRQAKRLWARMFVLLCSVCLGAMPIAHASGGGGHGGGGGPAPMTFVVNIGAHGQEQMVLQMSIVLKPATPEAGELINTFKPMIQHRVMIVAAGLTAEDLRKPEGRNEFGEKIVDEINHDLGTTTKNGIKEVLFTSFLYQNM